MVQHEFCQFLMQLISSGIYLINMLPADELHMVS